MRTMTFPIFHDLWMAVHHHDLTVAPLQSNHQETKPLHKAVSFSPERVKPERETAIVSRSHLLAGRCWNCPRFTWTATDHANEASRFEEALCERRAERVVYMVGVNRGRTRESGHNDLCCVVPARSLEGTQSLNLTFILKHTFRIVPLCLSSTVYM